MRRGRLIPLAVLAIAAALAVWLWGGGGLDRLAITAAEGQRDAQNAIARAVRAIKQGEVGALFGLLSVSFLYGLFHAAGPGHGKVLIGGYGMGRMVPAMRLAGLALLSSLAQSATAVLMVGAGIGLLNWTRLQVTGLADGVLSLASYLAIAGVGLWLAWRGIRGLIRSVRQAGAPHDHDHHDHDHTHDHDHSCTHSHGPTAQEAAQVRSLRDALVLIGAVAIRPCTGALFLLIITWRMDILGAGIAGTFAMGLGTASVTIAAALASVWLRRASVDRLRDTLPGAQSVARLSATAELVAGLLIALVALSLALRMI